MGTEHVPPATAAPFVSIRYVDAVEFGQHPVEWVLLVRDAGHVVLTVEGLPIARVEPLAPGEVLNRPDASASRVA